MRCVAFAAAAFSAVLAGGTWAQAPGERLRDPAADSMDFSKEPLTELPVKLPASSKPADMVAFDPGRPSTMKFYVDTASIEVGSDGIVRFTLVARGEGATLNVAYEGIRCKTRERKTFAYGRPDGTWYEPREPKWESIGWPATDAPRFALYQDYFCPSRQIISSSREGAEALRRGGHPRASDLLTGAPMRR